MSLGAGMKRRSPNPSSRRTCQTQEKPDRRDEVEQALARLVGQGAHCSASRACAHHFLLEHAPDVELEPAELGRGRQRHQIARMRKRHVDDLLDAARMRRHDHRPVAQEQRLLDRMGDVDHGLAGLLPDAHQLRLQKHAVLRIERRERLVHQQHAGIGDEGAGDGAALAHAAGQLMRIVTAEPAQADEPERRLDALGRLAATHPAGHQAEADIGLDVHPGKQAALLEHHRVLDRPAGRLDLDGAAGLAIQAGEDAQQGRLAATARADDAQELPRRDRQADVIDRDDPRLAGDELLVQRDDLDRGAAPLREHSVLPAPGHVGWSGTRHVLARAFVAFSAAHASAPPQSRWRGEPGSSRGDRCQAGKAAGAKNAALTTRSLFPQLQAVVRITQSDRRGRM